MADNPYITREAWGSRTNWANVPKMKLPAVGVYIHHSVTPVTSDPCKDAKTVERVGIERFGRLSYSEMTHPSGVQLQGCGTYVGAHTAGHNSTTFGFVFIGNMLDLDQPTEAATWSLCATINAYRGFGLLVDAPFIRPHRAVKSTACPGIDDAGIAFIRAMCNGRA